MKVKEFFRNLLQTAGRTTETESEVPDAHWRTEQGLELRSKMAEANPELHAQVEEDIRRRFEDHEEQYTREDMAVARMLSGAVFGDDSTIILPSGNAITGEQINGWARKNL